MDISLSDFVTHCGSLLLLALLVLEIVDWTKLLLPSTSSNNQTSSSSVLPLIPRDNSICKDTIDGSDGVVSHGPVYNHQQRYINIITREAIVMEFCDPLQWHGYSSSPTSISMENNGNTIVINFIWPRDSVPFLEGGGLMNSHKFHSISFHWGASDGGEHSIDNVKYPLAMQLIHINKDTEPSSLNNKKKNSSNSIAVVSYLFQIKDNENCQLNPIVRSLCRIIEPESRMNLKPFQLDSLFSPFERKFYSYCQPVIQPTFHNDDDDDNNNATWIVNSMPMELSVNQINEFRKVYTHQQKQSQQPNNLDVYYHE